MEKPNGHHGSVPWSAAPGKGGNGHEDHPEPEAEHLFCPLAGQTADPGEKARPVRRRTALGWLVGIINAAAGLSLVAPTLGFIAGPLRGKQDRGRWIPVLKHSELAEGETRAVSFRLELPDGYMTAARTYCIYLHRKGRKITAFDTTCPHLGCHVQFKPAKKRYLCPCHGGTFDEEGNHIAGPPPHGLDTYPTRISGGHIWIYKV